MKKKHMVVANWKMNPVSINEARELFGKIRNAVKKLRSTSVVVAPSFLHIPSLSRLVPSKNLSLGAQNVHEKDFGAHTGEVSAPMLTESKVRYVILGHSERRAMGESDDIIKQKVLNSLRHGITPIICVGEKERDSEGAYLNLIRSQISNIFYGLQKKYLSDCIITYEPSWAIGHTFKDSVSGNDMHEMSLFIRKNMSELFGKDYGWNMKILYGGSVESENAKDIMERGDVSGFLVGHASLEIDQFKKIISIVDSFK